MNTTGLVGERFRDNGGRRFVRRDEFASRAVSLGDLGGAHGVRTANDRSRGWNRRVRHSAVIELEKKESCVFISRARFPTTVCAYTGNGACFVFARRWRGPTGRDHVPALAATDSGRPHFSAACDTTRTVAVTVDRARPHADTTRFGTVVWSCSAVFARRAVRSPPRRAARVRGVSPFDWRNRPAACFRSFRVGRESPSVRRCTCSSSPSSSPRSRARPTAFRRSPPKWTGNRVSRSAARGWPTSWSPSAKPTRTIRRRQVCTRGSYRWSARRWLRARRVDARLCTRVFHFFHHIIYTRVKSFAGESLANDDRRESSKIFLVPKLYALINNREISRHAYADLQWHARSGNAGFSASRRFIACECRDLSQLAPPAKRTRTITTARSSEYDGAFGRINRKTLPSDATSGLGITCKKTR